MKLVETPADLGKRRHLGERQGGEFRNEPGYKVFCAGAFDDQRELHRRVAHLDRGLGIRILGAVNDIGPSNQFFEAAALKPEFSLTDVGDELRAGAEFGVKELPPALVASEVLGIGLTEKGALVMVKPPSQAIARRIFEINDGVLIADKQTIFEQLPGSVRQAAIVEPRLGVYRSLVETGEKGG